MDPATVSDLHILNAVQQAAKDEAYSQGYNTNHIIIGETDKNIASIASDQRLTIATNDTISKSQLANREAIERNGQFAISSTERNGVATTLAVERNSITGMESTERNGSVIMNAIERTTGDIKTSQERIAGETRQIVGTNNTAAALLGKDIQIQICDTAGKLSIQSSQNTGKLEVDIKKVKASLELQASQNTAEIQLEAVKHKASLSAQLAECCCEIKETVKCSSQDTQKVLQEIENNRIRDALAQANTENLISRFGSSK